VRRVGILVGLLILVAAGGGLTAIVGDNGIESILPFLRQSSNPAASAMEAESWQSEQLILLAGFILFNMVGIGATIAGIMWFLNRQVAIVRAEEAEDEAG